MTARTMFRARIALGTREVPVRMYAAAQDHGVHFRMLHAEDLQPVAQVLVDPRTGAPVEAEAVRRGVEVEPGRFVVLTREELDALAPPTDRVMQVEGFVRRETVDSAYYDRPYFLGPDGADEGYFALAAALQRAGRVAVVRWSMRKQRYVGGLLEHDGYLALMKLRRAAEVALPSATIPPRERAADPKQVALGRQLVATLEEDFDPLAYEDDNAARLEALLERKRAGEPVPLRPATPPPRADDLMDALRASLDAAKERRSA